VLFGLVVGGCVALATIAAIVAALSEASVTRRFGIALLFALGPALVLAWASRPLPGRDEPPRDWPHAVLLITVDTLRADHLGAYGYARDTSPRIDAMAAESVLFERAYAPMPTTDPSHVAILTGLLPRSSGVIKNGLASAAPDAPSLASWFGERGYRTGAVSSRAHLDPAALRVSGFQTASMPTHASPAPEAHRRAASWIRRHGALPFFLWVHFWDPHAPYAPPMEEASRFIEGLPPGRFVHGIDPYVPRPRPHTADEIRYATALYDAEIRHADAWVGRLVAETRERFGRESVLVVLTSDHGETLGELDEEYRYAFDHGKLLAHHELHVPLLMSWPGHLPQGLRVQQPVPTAGIASTLASALGDDFGSGAAGFSDLLGAGASGTTSDSRSLLVERRSFDGEVEVPFLAAPELGVIQGSWFYVENPVRGVELHEVRTERGSERNLAPDQAERVTRLADVLRRLALDHPPPTDVTDSMDQEKIEKLRSLGYIQ
jgi:arylsulfatase A-like enzyme